MAESLQFFLIFLMAVMPFGHCENTVNQENQLQDKSINDDSHYRYQQNIVVGNAYISNNVQYPDGQNGKGNFVCPVQMGRFANPYDCSEYFLCRAGVAYLMKCPQGQMYDEDLEECKDQALVDCKGRRIKDPNKDNNNSDLSTKTHPPVTPPTATTTEASTTTISTTPTTAPTTTTTAATKTCTDPTTTTTDPTTTTAAATTTTTAATTTTTDLTTTTAAATTTTTAATTTPTDPTATTTATTTTTDPTTTTAAATTTTTDPTTITTAATTTTTATPTTTAPPTILPPVTSDQKPNIPPTTTCDQDDVNCIEDQTKDLHLWYDCPTEFGEHPHPLNKQLFIHCDRWYPHLKRCPAYTVFSPESHVCVWKNKPGDMSEE